MNLLMISGDRSLASGKRGAFFATLEELRNHWERIDILCPRAKEVSGVRYPTSANATVGRQVSGFDNVFFHTNSYGLWYQPLWILRKGKELCRQRQYTVMTVHDYPPFYNGLGAWFLHRATGVPWVSEIHHIVGYPIAASVQEWVGKGCYPLYCRTIGRSASAFRVVNSGTCELLAKLGVQRERIHLVPSFYLDHELLTPDPSIRKTYDVVFCGRLVVNKGARELLEAIAMLCPSTALQPSPRLRPASGMTQSPRLLVIGDGPLRQNLEAIHTSHVTFAGWLPSPQDVYRAMQAAKVFVMCSKSEGGPRVLLEAMALGLPVIATNVGVVPDVIRDGENGLIASGTPQDLAEKIQTLLSDGTLRARLGQRAREVLHVFERKKLIRAYAHLLQSFGIL